MQAHKSHLPAGKQETFSLNLVDLDKVLNFQARIMESCTHGHRAYV